jgi:hypothetical protein
MMLAGKVPLSMRGSAFGFMGLLEKAAATMISTSAAVLFGLMIGECLAMSLNGYRYLLH